MVENLLARETSPYLLQHKDNPVAWMPWGDAAFARARAGNRPVLLSVGYAACHWCHVMAHESFENPETAARMNALYVNVKVDREERPDLDAIYQHALALLGEQGGWPLTMFLTPAREPFWGGTYFPPEPRYGRPGFPQVLDAIHRVYREQPERLRENVAALRGGLERLSRPPARAPGQAGKPADIGIAQLDEAAGALHGMVDGVLGGLRGAPKFPHAPLFEALWRAWLRTGKAGFAQAVTVTCERMCQGGIYDHLGGGFARYSTDPLWLVPHFEKMLYDNAQLIELLTLVWQGAHTPLFEARVRETVAWLEREMVAESGAFAATLDADTEGEEGRFYVWREDEIEAVLGADARLFKAAYDVSAGGNWEGRNVLNRLRVPELERAEDEARLPALRRRLFDRRERRPRPGRDDKVLADWNGLAIAALVRAGQAFGEPGWIAAARRAFDAVAATMSDGDRLAHSWRRGEARHAGMLEDYAFMARAALALHETDGEPRALDLARRWTAVLEARFRDSGGGYFQSAADAGDVIVRPMSVADSALPSGNGAMVGVLASLAALTGEDSYRQGADRLVEAFAGQIARDPVSACTFLNGVEQVVDGVQIVVVGAADDPATGEFVGFVNGRSLPGRTLAVVAGADELPAGHPAAGKTRVDGKATVYVCRGATCSPPATDRETLERLLRRPAA